MRLGVLPSPELSDASATFRLLGEGLMLISFVFSSAVVFIVSHVHCHFLNGLDLSLDSWCCSILHDPHFEHGVDSWNCMQAIMKCIGRELSSSFLAVQVFGALGMVYCLISSLAVAFETRFAPEPFLIDGWSLIPMLAFFALNVKVCSHGAALTEKCRNIPAFVNQIPTDARINPDRQYLVRFVLDSAAGFNVKHFTITQDFFVKNFILLGGFLSGMIAVLSRLY